jgi:hypothetical protein
MGTDVLEELTKAVDITGDELLAIIIVVGPFDIDGQKAPVCCRQLN